MKKILWFDVETTGLSPVENDPIQIAGLIEVDGEIEEEFNIFSQPFNPDNVSDEALKINSITREQLATFQPCREAKLELDHIFGKHIDKYDRNDKFFPAGYNARFDVDFLAEWYRKQGDKYIGSYWNWRTLDPLAVLHIDMYNGKIDLPDLKLETVCEHYGVKIEKAHDALSDIKATRELAYKIGIFEKKEKHD